MKKHKLLIIYAAIIAVIIIALGINWFFILDKAHSSFDNYYQFRGCTQLLTKTPDNGTCKIGNGQTIKIVKFNGKWYLDGDLPPGW